MSYELREFHDSRKVLATYALISISITYKPKIYLVNTRYGTQHTFAQHILIQSISIKSTQFGVSQSSPLVSLRYKIKGKKINGAL